MKFFLGGLDFTKFITEAEGYVEKCLRRFSLSERKIKIFFFEKFFSNQNEKKIKKKFSKFTF